MPSAFAQPSRRPVLLYVYAEPLHWPDGRQVPAGDFKRHRDEIADFAAAISGDEVAFRG